MFETSPDGSLLVKYCPESTETHITIPEGIEAIGSQAFSNCINMVSIKLSSSVRSIYNNAFNNCPQLTKIFFNDGFRSLGSGYGSDSPFINCPKLTELELPATICRIGIKNTNIEVICIRDGIEKIPDHFFAKIQSLQSVCLPESVRMIGEGAFAYCTRLNNVQLPPKLTSIGLMAFWKCECLEHLDIPSSVRTIGNDCFNGCGIKSVTLPEGITSIEECTFSDCKNLHSCILPESVTVIHKHAFFKSGLRNIRIPPNVRIIGENAFLICDNLKEITFCSSNTKFVKNFSMAPFPESTRLRGETFHLPGRWNHKKIWITLFVLWLIYCLVSLVFNPCLLYGLLFVCAYCYCKKEYRLEQGFFNNMKYILEILFGRKWYERVPTV